MVYFIRFYSLSLSLCSALIICKVSRFINENNKKYKYQIYEIGITKVQKYIDDFERNRNFVWLFCSYICMQEENNSIFLLFYPYMFIVFVFCRFAFESVSAFPISNCRKKLVLVFITTKNINFQKKKTLSMLCTPKEQISNSILANF